MTENELKRLEGEVILLQQLVERIGSICFQYMPPAGQKDMEEQLALYHKARRELLTRLPDNEGEP